MECYVTGLRRVYSSIYGKKTMNIEQRIQQAITQNMPETPTGGKEVKFDPIIGGLIATLLKGLLENCLDNRIKRQHAILNKRPDGSFANRFKMNVAAQLRRDDKTLSEEAINVQSMSALKAFKSLSEDELDSFIEDVRSENATQTRNLELVNALL